MGVAQTQAQAIFQDNLGLTQNLEDGSVYVSGAASSFFQTQPIPAYLDAEVTSSSQVEITRELLNNLENVPAETVTTYLNGSVPNCVNAAERIYQDASNCQCSSTCSYQ